MHRHIHSPVNSAIQTHIHTHTHAHIHTHIHSPTAESAPQRKSLHLEKVRYLAPGHMVGNSSVHVNMLYPLSH